MMFRFSIREILLLTVVVALGFGWWLHLRRVQGKVATMQQRLAEQEKEIKKEQLLSRFLQLRLEQSSDECDHPAKTETTILIGLLVV